MVQPRLLINHIKKKINLHYHIFQIELYPEKIITLEKINSKKCIIQNNNVTDKCPICYQNFGIEKEGTTKLYCKHVFHFNCINRWFKQKEIMNEDLVCPICKKKHIINIC